MRQHEAARGGLVAWGCVSDRPTQADQRTSPWVHPRQIPIRGCLRIPDRATKPSLTKPLFSRVANGTRTRDPRYHKPKRSPRENTRTHGKKSSLPRITAPNATAEAAQALSQHRQLHRREGGKRYRFEESSNASTSPPVLAKSGAETGGVRGVARSRTKGGGRTISRASYR